LCLALRQAGRKKEGQNPRTSSFQVVTYPSNVSIMKVCRRLEHFTINPYTPNNDQDRQASKLTTIIHKERTLYTTICSKKDMSIKLQGVRSSKNPTMSTNEEGHLLFIE
jgi:hypothetical protein